MRESVVVRSEEIKYQIFEMFGPTIQGEGKYVGQLTYFIRLAGCDNNCEWCDTKQARNGIEPNMTARDIIRQLDPNICRMVTLTGGNPCIHELTLLVQELKNHGFLISVETQGTVWKNWLQLVDYISISPKAYASGNETDIESIAKFCSKCLNLKIDHMLKVVVMSEQDLQYVDLLLTIERSDKIIIQVADEISSEFKLEEYSQRYLKLVELILNKAKTDKRYNSIKVLPQMHKVIWGRREGV